MAAPVSLGNMTFWVPPAVAVPECASQVKQQEQLLSQPEYSSPHVSEEQPHTLGFTGPTTNEPILIPSDTEGRLDIDDTNGDNGCRDVGWHSDDTLLSADALVPSLATASPDDVCYIVASDDIPEGSLTQPPSPKGSEEEDLREGRGRAPNADKERTQTNQRSNPNFNINADIQPHSNSDYNTQGYQEGLEYGILPGLPRLPLCGDSKANNSPDVDQYILKRRKTHKSIARVDNCSREVHRELFYLITASKPKTTSETSYSYNSIVRGDQEYSPPARNSHATEALSESCLPMMILTTMPANGVSLDDPQPAASLANDYMLPVHQAADHHRMTSKMRVTHGLRQRRFKNGVSKMLL
ncbi:hypothetical protein BGZ61DRAFT_516503 [Ilyonectria robusta]|uniref:uncharacterized protein n=1 Tax=Ilyonectria robusta TaxID=1079257 RepID=UPI001E8EDA5C|nr:uncharacterized protein BGZ61DRAFT_516503 [Ilyonectria robusta]KAH8714215.1 hypothetical protein BGZ61DRAFT_516503 [Ilyonectria robusta]